MQELKQFDIVKIAETSQFYKNNGTFNPRETEGIVHFIGKDAGSGMEIVFVSWSNGTQNTYFKEDLEYVGSSSSAKIELDDSFRINPDVYYAANKFDDIGLSEEEILMKLLKYENYLRNLEGIPTEDEEVEESKSKRVAKKRG